MVNPAIVAAKLADLADRVERVRARLPSSSDELAADRDALDLVSFNLMLAVQICADISSHIVADEGWPTAATLAKGFRLLEQKSVISSVTAEQMCRAVGLRNVVAHGYVGIDPNAVYAAGQTGVDDLDRFAREVAAWTQNHTPQED